MSRLMITSALSHPIESLPQRTKCPRLQRISCKFLFSNDTVLTKSVAVIASSVSVFGRKFSSMQPLLQFRAIKESVQKSQTMIIQRCSLTFLLAVLLSFAVVPCTSLSSLRSSAFHGKILVDGGTTASSCSTRKMATRSMMITMRKQKASDKRTTRRQRGGEEVFQSTAVIPLPTNTFMTSPMQGNLWKNKLGNEMAAVIHPTTMNAMTATAIASGGRQRSRKRSMMYNTLAFYHNTFLNQLTFEYKAEEEQVLGRIKASIDDPVGLEIAGHALFDMWAERRGNLFSDEVYRLQKAKDATTTYPRSQMDPSDDTTAAALPSAATTSNMRYLPPNHKISRNDVVLLTLQPTGSGDYFSTQTLPTSETAVSIEARVLNVGPTYVDIAIKPGTFQAAFGPASNDFDAPPGMNKDCRLRVDRFFSNVPYQRMVAALAAFTSLPDRKPPPSSSNTETKKESNNDNSIQMDEVLREIILQTFASHNEGGPTTLDPDLSNWQDLSNKLAKPPMGKSHFLAQQVLRYIKTNNNEVFPKFNAPQLAAIEAALTRRLTMVHGPPGTGKTAVASAVAFGFAHQCRSLSNNAKVLACAFSNVGADNLAEAIRLKLGLNVVRIGKPSAVSENLWNCTLDAAIDRDPDAQKALKRAAKVTAQLTRFQRDKKSSANSMSERLLRDAATAAVKASNKACNLAATKALREADVIVTTSTGAADPRLLAACGIITGEDVDDDTNTNSGTRFGEKVKINDRNNAAEAGVRENAPDGLPPLSLPFVVVDEACQSVEPATLIPLVASNSCRAVVMFGDPCQLPPTVLSRQASGLSLSLMERLASVLPHPSIPTAADHDAKDTLYLDALPVKQAKSLLRARDFTEQVQAVSYRKKYSGSVLLPIQYRMHPSIAAFPSSIFYDGQLATPQFMDTNRRFPLVLRNQLPCADSNLCVRLIDVGGRFNERQGVPSKYTRTVFSSKQKVASSLEDQTTYWNEPEAERVVSLVRDIVDDPTREVQSLGIVTPYNGQVQLIKSMISGDRDLRKALLTNPVSIEVKSVDGYQGRERDLIIFSAVRSNRQARIGFLHDWRRMNVALTRAKSGLVVVGDFDTLADADKHWDALKKWAAGYRCITDDYDDLDEEPSI